jgi:hypothetical protein
MFKLNRILAISDTIVSAIAILTLGACAWYFNKWGIVLFSIIPLLLFYSHTIVMDADYEPVERGGDEDAR